MIDCADHRRMIGCLMLSSSCRCVFPSTSSGQASWIPEPEGAMHGSGWVTVAIRFFNDVILLYFLALNGSYSGASPRRRSSFDSSSA